MPQVNGALAQLLLQREATFRTAPAVPAAFKLPFTKWDSAKDTQKKDDPSISASPLPGKKGCGNPVLNPTLNAILDLRSVGHVLALLLGVPTANKAVTVQPTNVTGVTVNYAETGTTTGNGTLDFTFTGKTLSWMAQGDVTPGAAVDVTAGGYFTLESSTADHSIHVTVSAAALPGVDKTDADIAVSATLKCHVFPFNLNVRPSALIEPGLTDAARFYRTLGCKVNTLKYDVTSPEQSIDVGLIAGVESEETVVWDAAPTSYQSVRACGSGGSVWNGVDTALGTVVGGSFNASNNMKGELVAQTESVPLASASGFGLITQGELSLSGDMKVVFDTLGAYALARAGTSTRLRIASRGVSGSDVFGLFWDMPNVAFDEKSVPIEGKTGILATVGWYAHRDTAGSLPLVTLVNDVASY